MMLVKALTDLFQRGFKKATGLLKNYEKSQLDTEISNRKMLVLGLTCNYGVIWGHPGSSKVTRDHLV